ncbi:hypothetical protein KFU94_49700 [Chloroflexi bacterium TSY]|nr:hypothetical protein [Chloroflexi bacterium TSY]
MSNQYEMVLQTLKSKKLKADQPAVLLGHFSVAGAKLRLESDQAQQSYAGFETSYARELSVSREALLASDQVPQYNALGHIHLAQSVPETIAPTYYAGAPDYFERGEENYQPQVLLVDVPSKGEVNVEPILLKQVTPFIAETITNRSELQALVENLGASVCQRALGDLIIKVGDIADYAPLRDEAYSVFPRLKEANTVQAETPEPPLLKFETTDDYAQIANPATMFEDYFNQNFAAEDIPSLQQALDTIMQELIHEN